MSRDARSFCATISFEVDKHERVEQILLKTNLISFAESLGGVESLITFPEAQTHADIPPELRAGWIKQRATAFVRRYRRLRRSD